MRPSGSTPEWIAGGLSARVVLALIGYRLGEGWKRPDRPPEIVVRADSVLAQEGGFLVTFTARNEGHETAAGVTVRGTLLRDTTSVEESEVTIDFVPIGSERRSGLLFRNDPRTHSLELAVTGFDLP